MGVAHGKQLKSCEASFDDGCPSGVIEKRLTLQIIVMNAITVGLLRIKTNAFPMGYRGGVAQASGCNFQKRVPKETWDDTHAYMKWLLNDRQDAMRRNMANLTIICPSEVSGKKQEHKQSWRVC